jgi:hypothetical protein
MSKPKPKKNVTKKKGQKVSIRKPSKAAKSIRTGRANSKAKTGGKRVKRAKPVYKALAKGKVSQPKKPPTTSPKKAKRNVARVRFKEVGIARRKRNSERIKVSFGKTKDIESKIQSFANSKKLSDSIDKQLKRKKGKPPKGLIIIVRDKKGAEAAHVTRPSFVANKKNIEKELAKFTKDLKKDYGKTVQQLADIKKQKKNLKGEVPRPRKPRKRKSETKKRFNFRVEQYEKALDKWHEGELTSHEWEGLQLGGGGGEDSGYGEYNPDNIASIDLQFIY